MHLKSLSRDSYASWGALALAVGLTAAACSSGGSDTVTLLTHDSFAISEATLEQFTAETGLTVEILRAGDAGRMLSQAILTKDNPLADVIFGVDNAFLSRALEAGITRPYEPSRLGQVIPAYRLDASNSFTPIDFGDVCLNYDKAALAELGVDPPETFTALLPVGQAADAVKELADSLVVEDPATSSPGLAFLLATIVVFGEGESGMSWQDYWRGLRDNGVLVVSGWEQAYYGNFSAASDGDRPLVVSYASSPVAEVIFASEPPTEAPTGIVEASCFRQVEFAGILAGSDSGSAAEKLIDIMLSKEFQEDIPLNMFVFPVVSDAAVPIEFQQHTVVVEDPLRLPPELIEENRDRWIQEWTEIVLR